VARRAVVFTEHTPGREWQVSERGRARGAWIAWHNRLLQPFTRRVVACARWQIPILTSEGIAESAIVHIPNGVPIGQIAAASRAGPTRAQLGISADARVVIQAARFFPQKNQRATFEAVARLREQIGDVRLLLVGDGPDRESLERDARERSADWCLFLGERDDVPSLIGLADVAVLPSTAEAMPMSMIEAMAAGVPFVGTDVGDMRAVLEETGAGLWAPVDDMDAFVDACRRLLSDEPLRRKVAEAARRSAVLFDADTMSDAYARLFEDVVSGGSSRS
jgi:glycosyltransferase involved in cell wall biosynthesis